MTNAVKRQQPSATNATISSERISAGEASRLYSHQISCMPLGVDPIQPRGLVARHEGGGAPAMRQRHIRPYEGMLIQGRQR